MNHCYQPRRAPTVQERQVRGLRVHLTCWAGSDPHTFVLVHGFMDTGDTFQFLVDALSDRHTCVAPDLRGFGRSGWPQEGYWFPDYFGDLDGLLDSLGLEAPVTLVGHSMGGNIAMTYAGLRPERVARVINIEGFGLPPMSPEQSPERLRQWLDQLRGPPEASVFPSVDALAQMLRKRHPRLRADRAAFIARAWTRGEPDGRARLLFDPAHRRVNPVLYRREESEACWREARAPLLYVLARQSEFLARMGDLAQPATMAAIVPGLESCWIEDAGHMVHHEQPEALAGAIEAFLARHPVPPAAR